MLAGTRQFRAILGARLRHSERHLLTFDLNGHAVAMQLEAPENCVRLSNLERILLSHFPCAYSVPVSDVISRLPSLHQESISLDVLADVLRCIRRLTESGLLVPDGASQNPFTNEMVEAYSLSRYIPERIGAKIVSEGQIGQNTRVLDIATGTGDLALQLAQASKLVVGIDTNDLSIAKAASAAKARGLSALFVNASGNRLLFDSKRFDVITIAQAFHWMDSYWLVKGIDATLVSDGFLFILDSKAALPRSHPIREIFGYGSLDRAGILNAFNDRIYRYRAALRGYRRSREAAEIDAVWTFHERRVFDFQFARSFFFDRHLTSLLPNEKNPWDYLQRRLYETEPGELAGNMYWLLARFQKRKVPALGWSELPIRLDSIHDPEELRSNDQV